MTMKAGELVLVAREQRGELGVIATETVNNAEKRNALGNAGKRQLAEAIEAISKDDTFQVIVLTGAGDKSFIGGANLDEMNTFVQHDAMEGSSLTHRVCDAVRRAPVLVIARINGWCLGAGLEIAASCNMRVAVADARFGMPEVLFGLPSGTEACLLPQIVGWGRARELVYTGRHMMADEALSCGLIERLAGTGWAERGGRGVGRSNCIRWPQSHPGTKRADPRLGMDVRLGRGGAGNAGCGGGAWDRGATAANDRLPGTSPLHARREGTGSGMKERSHTHLPVRLSGHTRSQVGRAG